MEYCRGLLHMLGQQVCMQNSHVNSHAKDNLRHGLQYGLYSAEYYAPAALCSAWMQQQQYLAQLAWAHSAKPDWPQLVKLVLLQLEESTAP